MQSPEITVEVIECPFIWSECCLEFAMCLGLSTAHQFQFYTKNSALGSPGGSVSRGGIKQQAGMSTQVACTCECGNEPSGSVKCGEFLD